MPQVVPEPQAQDPEVGKQEETRSPASPARAVFDSTAHEGLGPNYRDTPWVPPQWGLAQSHRAHAMFESGKAPLWGTGTRELASMGIGISMYFRMLKGLSIVMFLATLLVVPHLVLCWYGDAINEEDMDAFGLGKLTSGNLAELDADVTQENETALDPACTVDVVLAGTANCSERIYTLDLGNPDDPVRIKATHAAYIVAACDCLYSAIFLVFIWRLGRKLAHVVKHVAHETVTPEQYSVFVRGLPKDANEDEIREHFSGLYALNTVGWSFKGYLCGLFLRKRPDWPEAVTNHAGIPVGTLLQPVQDFTNTNEPKYQGSWVCEVSVAHANGAAIRAYRAGLALTLKVKNARALVKKYSADTPAKHGPSDARRRKAEKRLEKLQRKLDRLHKRVEKKGGSKANDCEAAFVTFKFKDSNERCIKDYAPYRKWWSRWLMPKRLRFRGAHQLNVSRASAPSNVLWENLDTPPLNRWMRRFAVDIVTVLLLLFSAGLIVAGQKTRESYEDDAPNLALCEDGLPQHYGVEEGDLFVYNQTLDAACHAATGDEGTFWVSFPDSPYADPFGDHPECLSPCVDPSDHTIACELGDPPVTYKKTTTVGCFCVDALLTAVEEEGLVAGAERIVDDYADLCEDFATSYALAQGLVMGAALMIVFVNTALKTILRAMARFERHHSVSKQSRSLTRKIYVAQFLNTALLVLLINAKMPRAVRDGLGDELLSGESEDFDKEWYATVGAAMYVTMAINAVVPHLAPFGKVLLAPVLRWFARHKITQLEMNRAVEPPPFEIATRYPLVLNVLTVTLALSSGLPLLLPLALLSFVLFFWLDKLLLLRFYHKPPNYDQELPLMSVQLLPWLLLLHLGMAGWIYGVDTVFEPEPLGTDMLGGNVDQSDKAAVEAEYEAWVERLDERDPIGIAAKITRRNAFPLFVFFFAVLAGMVYQRTAGRVVRAVVRRVLKVVTCGLCGGKPRVADSLDDKWKPAFTEPMGVPSAFVQTLTDNEREHGWLTEVMRDGYSCKFKVWSKSGSREGVPHQAGERKKTWEVIHDVGIHSYKIERNPRYRDAIVGFATSSSPAVMPM